MENSRAGHAKSVFLSYRYGDVPRFDYVRDIAARLRFFSIHPILDQRSLFYGEDIRAFMRDSIRTADSMILLLSKDYNDALRRDSGSGAGVRFEVQLALEERSRRPGFQLIPVLLDDSLPGPPLDTLKCARSTDIDEVVTQLGLVTSFGLSKELAGRYRVDRIVEMRGLARVFEGLDLITDIPVEIYQVPSLGDQLQGDRFRLFERVIRGRSAAASPFLLNIRDSHIDSDGAYYLITERFEGSDLGACLARSGTTHPFGALCLGYQAALGLHELHAAGVVHGGLAPQCIRLNSAETACKVVDFEFARPTDGRDDRPSDGYPMIAPPERVLGDPPTIQQDIYQLGNLMFWLMSGAPVQSTNHALAFSAGQKRHAFCVEDSDVREQLGDTLLKAVVEAQRRPFSDRAVEATVARVESPAFLLDHVTPLVAWCLDPNPLRRPQRAGRLLQALASLGVPPTGRLLDVDGVEVTHGLFNRKEAGQNQAR